MAKQIFYPFELVRAYFRLLLSLTFLVALSCNPNREVEYLRPQVTEITESVYASVSIRPEVAYFPQPIRSGIIQEVFVEEGEVVKTGQLLIRIAATADVKNRLNSAEMNLEEAKEDFIGENNLLLNIELELKNLEEQLALDSINYFRQKELWKQNIGKKVDLERYELAYGATQNNYKILRKKKAQTLRNLKYQYQRASDLAQAEQTQFEDFSLRSAMDGVVYAIYKEEGERIGSQERFAEIGSAVDFVIEMDIDEVDITKIEMGDTVAITLDAYEDEVFMAKVSKVLPKKDETTQTFRVESTFLKAPPKLYNGLAGEANIVVDKRKNALIIPSEYLLKGNKVQTEEGAIDVRIGVKNMEFVEIASGLDTSALLIKPRRQ